MSFEDLGRLIRGPTSKERPNHSMRAWHVLLLFTKVCNGHSYKDFYKMSHKYTLLGHQIKGKKRWRRTPEVLHNCSDQLAHIALILTTNGLFNPFTAQWALRAFIDFTLSNARRFYSSMGNPLAGKGLKRYWNRERAMVKVSCGSVDGTSAVTPHRAPI